MTKPETFHPQIFSPPPTGTGIPETLNLKTDFFFPWFKISHEKFSKNSIKTTTIFLEKHYTLNLLNWHWFLYWSRCWTGLSHIPVKPPLDFSFEHRDITCLFGKRRHTICSAILCFTQYPKRNRKLQNGFHTEQRNLKLKFPIAFILSWLHNQQ